MKKFVSIVMALLLLCTFTLSVSAAETGTITIKGLIEGDDYELYQLMDLQAFNAADNNYFYTVNADWAGFFATDEAKAYVSVDAEDGHVEWIAEKTDSVVAAFAQKALAYAELNGIDPVKSSKNEGEMTIDGKNGIFSDLGLGYYLVDSTIGVLCNLTTTDPSAEIDPKNTVPTIDKEIVGDDSASIGDIIEFQVTINVGAGAQKYVLHDKMEEGLTFVHDVANNRGIISITLAGEALAESVDYNVVLGNDVDGCTFEIVFTEDGMAKMDQNEVLVVSYNAQLNEKAVVEDAGTENQAHLQYGDEITSESTTDKTETKTYSMDIVKTDDNDKLLDGAKFEIYDALNGGNKISVVKVEDGVYRLAMPDETSEEIVVSGGKVTVMGFGNGTYYLQETAAPSGYNMLTSRKAFTITDGNLSANIVDGAYEAGTGVQVVNKTGSALPETGGMGTVIFVVVGTLAVLGAGVLLVTKKRMAMIEE